MYFSQATIVAYLSLVTVITASPHANSYQPEGPIHARDALTDGDMYDSGLYVREAFAAAASSSSSSTSTSTSTSSSSTPSKTGGPGKVGTASTAASAPAPAPAPISVAAPTAPITQFLARFYKNFIHASPKRIANWKKYKLKLKVKELVGGNVKTGNQPKAVSIISPDQAGLFRQFIYASKKRKASWRTFKNKIVGQQLLGKKAGTTTKSTPKTTVQGTATKPTTTPTTVGKSGKPTSTTTTTGTSTPTKAPPAIADVKNAGAGKSTTSTSTTTSSTSATSTSTTSKS